VTSEFYPGTLILVDHGSRTTWHHSVSFNGREHGTACGQGVGPDPIDEVRLNISEWHDLEGTSRCDECAGSVRSLVPRTERTRVGHCKRDETDIYAGRGVAGRSMNNTEIGSRGWLGNPYTLADGYNRAESIDLFRDDFEARLRADDEFRAAVRNLSGTVLGCWCRSLNDDAPACHAEVIAEHADRLVRSADAETDRSEGGDGR
jgi:hypothetical protein